MKVRATVDVPGHAASAYSAADFISPAEEFARRVRNEFPIGTATLEEVLVGTDVESDTIVKHTTCIAGGAAGNLTVTGILTTDILVSVWTAANIATDAGPPITADLTAEFSITATNTINNTAGTATTGKVVIVTYITRTVV